VRLIREEGGAMKMGEMDRIWVGKKGKEMMG